MFPTANLYSLTYGMKMYLAAGRPPEKIDARAAAGRVAGVWDRNEGNVSERGGYGLDSKAILGTKNPGITRAWFAANRLLLGESLRTPSASAHPDPVFVIADPI